MDIEKQLCLSSGEKLEIPRRLYQIMQGESLPDPSALKMNNQDESIEAILSLSEGDSPERLLHTLQLIDQRRSDEQRRDESLLYICLYAGIKAHMVLEQGDQEIGLELLLDGLELGNSAFSCIQPSIARHLADQMIVQSEEVISICSLSGSIQVLASRKVGLNRALDVALTFWEPEFTPLIQLIKREAEVILTHAGQLTQQNARGIHEAAILLKKDVQKRIGYKSGSRPEALKNLVGSILEMFQQEILLTAHTAYTSDGLNSETIHFQAERLVEKVEKRLRTIIAKKYQQQFGPAWVQHISSRYQDMYERWQRYMRKDRSAFRLYEDYSPELLEYALLEDLRDLIASQWHLFREIFNFGYQDRNKSVFLDKISQIMSVRNALAHHRSPPENELLRTRVLCTDLLLAMDRSGETSE